MLDTFRKKHNNLNDRNRKEIVAYCETWDENECQNCQTSFEDLEYQAQIKEEITGKKRILPVYTVDHIDNDDSHLDGYIDVDENSKRCGIRNIKKTVKRIWHKWGNCRRLCWPCNRLEGIRKRKTILSDKVTREKQDRLNNQDKFLFECEQQINERGHICYKAIAKAGENICGMGEHACARYLDTAIKTPENPNGKFIDFAYTCEGRFCNGSHVSWVNVKPDIIIDEERKLLEREWSHEYPDYDQNTPEDKDKIRQFKERFLKPWISKQEFITPRLKLTW